MFQATVLNEDNVKALGRDFGVKGFDGTGPYCWTSWEPRNQTVLTRRPEYKWGPPFYANRGPAKFEKIVFRIVPEEAARLAAMASGQMDLTIDDGGPVSAADRQDADAVDPASGAGDAHLLSRLQDHRARTFRT